MGLWFAYDFLALIIRDYMAHTGQCLYNALVIKISRQPDAYLLRVRDDLLNVIKMIEDEVAERQARRAA
jgi:hypothetical protein